jgi:hypothetical protein
MAPANARHAIDTARRQDRLAARASDHSDAATALASGPARLRTPRWTPPDREGNTLGSIRARRSARSASYTDGNAVAGNPSTSTSAPSAESAFAPFRSCQLNRNRSHSLPPGQPFTALISQPVSRATTVGPIRLLCRVWMASTEAARGYPEIRYPDTPSHHLPSVGDLLPRLLHGRRQFIHVLQKQCQGPDLLVVQRILPGWHAGPPNAVLHFPE